MSMFRKILDGVKPFNDCYYIDCYYNALFSMLPRYQVSNEGVLTNYIPVYDQSEDLGIKLSWIANRDRHEVLKEIGIEEKESLVSDNIIDEIKMNILQKKPVIVYIDCFYEKNRYDTYLRMHWPHTFLVYGYDDLEESVLVIEHSNRESLDYAPMKLSYEEVEKCYSSLIRQYGENGKNTVHVFDQIAIEHETKDYFEDYLSHMRSNEDKIHSGIKQLAVLKEKMQSLVCDSDEYKGKVEDIVSLLNDIVNSKIAQAYILERYEGMEPYVLQLNKIEKLWRPIRSKILKCHYSGEINAELIMKAWNSIDDIIKEENRYYDELLFSCL